MEEPMIDKIKALITDEINPYLAIQSGGCELVDYADGILTVKVFGGCSGCPSSQMRLFEHISSKFKEKIPEISDIILA